MENKLIKKTNDNLNNNKTESVSLPGIFSFCQLRMLIEQSNEC